MSAFVGAVSPKPAGLRTAAITYGFGMCGLKTLKAFSEDGVYVAPGPDMWEQRGGPEQGAPRREAQEAGDMEITC